MPDQNYNTGDGLTLVAHKASGTGRDKVILTAEEQAAIDYAANSHGTTLHELLCAVEEIVEARSAGAS